MRIGVLLVAIALGTACFFPSRVACAEAALETSAKKKVGLVFTTQKTLPKAAGDVETSLSGNEAFELTRYEGKVEYDDIASEALRVLEEAGFDALVVVGTLPDKKSKVLEIRVFDAHEGRLITTFVLRGKNEALLGEAVREDERLREAIAQAEGRAKGVAPPPAEPIAPSPVVEPEASGSEPAESHGIRLPIFAAFVAAKLYSRSFVYTNSLSELFGNGYDALPSYSLPMAPMPHASVELLPWGASSGVFAGLGLGAEGEFDTFTSLVYRTSILSQTHYRFSVGPLYKLPLGSWILSAEGRFGRHVFSIDGDRTVSGEDAFPSVAYSMVEAGLGVEYAGETTRLAVRASHLALLGLGEIGGAPWFPSAHGRGLAVGAFLSRSLSPSWALRVGIDGRVIGLDFNPIQPSAPQSRIAGGATDQYLGLSLGLEFRAFGESAMTTRVGPKKSEKKDDFDDFE